MTEVQLLRAYYEARKTVILGMGSNFREDLRELEQEVDDYSREHFGHPFDFEEVG
jgi:hypothetical protein